MAHQNVSDFYEHKANKSESSADELKKLHAQVRMMESTINDLKMSIAELEQSAEEQDDNICYGFDKCQSCGLCAF